MYNFTQGTTSLMGPLLLSPLGGPFSEVLLYTENMESEYKMSSLPSVALFLSVIVNLMCNPYPADHDYWHY